MSVIRKGVKQRQDSVEQYTKGNRPELAAKESSEIEILKAHLPAELPDKVRLSRICMAASRRRDGTLERLGRLTNAVCRYRYSGARVGQKRSRLTSQSCE